jgi:secondary thiamine-phosphate synthase enzyme
MAEMINVRSGAREQLLDITDRVAKVVATSGVPDGVVHLWSLHTTCGLTVNEGFDPDVAADMVRFMAQLVPASAAFRHQEGNSDSHIKTALFGPGLTLIIEDGELLLGQWQKIFLAEWDGPREREITMIIQPIPQ